MNTFDKKILAFASHANAQIRNSSNELRHEVIHEAQKTFAALVNKFVSLPQAEQQRHQTLVDSTRDWLHEEREKERRRLANL